MTNMVFSLEVMFVVVVVVVVCAGGDGGNGDCGEGAVR